MTDPVLAWAVSDTVRPMTDERSIPTYPDLAGKVAVVTGGSLGIGKDTALVLAANGVKVVVNARRQEGVDAVAETIRDAGGTAIGVAADVTTAAGLATLRERTEAELGPADLLVPFAGGFTSFTPIQEISEQEWREVIDWNLTSTFLALREFLPGMIDRQRGSIVTMSSNGGRFLDVTLTASYAAAKAAVIQLTRHVAKEVGKHGIRANCVAPATVLSERIEAIVDGERRARVEALSPLGTMGVPRDVSNAAVFLLSDAAGWLTGVTIDVAGGRVML